MNEELNFLIIKKLFGSNISLFKKSNDFDYTETSYPIKNWIKIGLVLKGDSRIYHFLNIPVLNVGDKLESNYFFPSNESFIITKEMIDSYMQNSYKYASSWSFFKRFLISKDHIIQIVATAGNNKNSALYKVGEIKG